MATQITIPNTNVSGYVLPAKIEELKFPFTLKFNPAYKPTIRRKATTQSQGGGTMTNYFTVTDNRKVFEIIGSDFNYMVSKDGAYIDFVANGGSEKKRLMVYEPINSSPENTSQAGFGMNNGLLLLGSWGLLAFLYSKHKTNPKYKNLLLAYGAVNLYWSYRVFFKSK